MTDQLAEIGGRLTGLRDVIGIPSAEMAEHLKIGLDEYTAYEKGERDFSFSFLYNVAEILGVDVVDIISGDSPKLSMCAVVRKDKGYDIARREDYDYKHLAFTFRKKKAEPFMVTVQPKPGKEIKLHDHEGQEFNYMVSGSMRFFHGDNVYVLNEGDSVYFDSVYPHAMEAVGDKPAQFIAVVMHK